MTERPYDDHIPYPTPSHQLLIQAARDDVQPTGLKALRAAGRITRYHSAGETLAQRVDSHSWGVVTLILHLWPDATRELIVAAVLHDVGESWTGDISAVTKWQLSPDAQREIDAMESKGIKATCPNVSMTPEGDFVLSTEDSRRLSIADQLELMLHCLERMKLGDRLTAWGPFWRVAGILFDKGLPPQSPEGRLLGAMVADATECHKG